MKIRTLLVIILLITALTPIALVMGLNLPRVLKQFDIAEINRKLLVLQQEHLEASREMTWCQDTLRALSFSQGVVELVSNTSATFPRHVIHNRVSKMVGGWYQKSTSIVGLRLINIKGQEQLKMIRSDDGLLQPAPTSELCQIDIASFLHKIKTRPAHTVFNAGVNRGNMPSVDQQQALLYIGVAIYKEDVMVGVACLAFDLTMLVDQYSGALFQQDQPDLFIYSAQRLGSRVRNTPLGHYDFSPAQPTLVKDTNGESIRLMPLFIGNNPDENIWMASATTSSDTVLWVQQWRRQIAGLIFILVCVVILVGLKLGTSIERFTTELSTAFRELLQHQRPMHFSWSRTKELQNLGKELTTLSTQYLENATAREQMRNETERMAQKLRHSQKMEAIGLMAGGVAHDLNNILSGIVGYPQLLLLQLPPESPLRKSIIEIQHSGERAAAVVDDLLTVARGVASTRETYDLNKLIREYLASPEYAKLTSLHPHITYDLDLQDLPLLISCSAIHIKKTIMNLIINASEAMPSAGSVTITSYQTTRQESDNWIKLIIQDEGIGISAKDIDHIFEPFYTKKNMGRSGTGLGLSVVWNTMKDHEGSITVKSDDRGTTFTLLFPIQTEENPQPKISPDVDLAGHGESILVIDDEFQPRDIAQKILTSYGYTVDVVPSGEEAIAFCRQQSVDLILLDMIMDPGINGQQTYEQIKQIHPKQKAIIVSGFSSDEAVRKVQACGAHGFIKKPYSMEQLGQIVKEELGRN